MAGQQPSTPPRLYRRTFDDTRSRCTTDVWLSLSEHRLVLGYIGPPGYNGSRTTYKSIHTGNSHRLSQKETMVLWKLSREAWMSKSVTDAPPRTVEFGRESGMGRRLRPRKHALDGFKRDVSFVNITAGLLHVLCVCV
jgi:hypothetical protein